MNKATTTMWRAKTPTGWKRFPVIMNGDRIKKGWVLVDGIETEYPEGHFCVRQYRKGAVVYTKLETDDAVMAAVLARKEKRKLLVKGGVEQKRKVLRKMADAYIADCKKRRAFEAAAQAKLVLDEFCTCAHTTYVDGITRDDIYRFHKVLRKRECSDRTVANKHARLKSFLKFTGIDYKAILPPAPKFEAALPTVYTSTEIKAILAAADGRMAIAINMALKLGLRDQELAHAEWGDINEHEKTFRVQGKTHWKFKVKDSEQRDVPLPDDLIEELKAWKKISDNKQLILGTALKKPDRKMLRSLKRLAKRSKLNCEACDGCKGELGECQKWTLHKFRRTYATTLLRSAVDLKTVQHWMGHSDLASTMRYLRPAAGAEAQAKVNAIQWS